APDQLRRGGAGAAFAGPGAGQDLPVRVGGRGRAPGADGRRPPGGRGPGRRRGAGDDGAGPRPRRHRPPLQPPPAAGRARRAASCPAVFVSPPARAAVTTGTSASTTCPYSPFSH